MYADGIWRYVLPLSLWVRYHLRGGSIIRPLGTLINNRSLDIQIKSWGEWEKYQKLHDM